MIVSDAELDLTHPPREARRGRRVAVILATAALVIVISVIVGATFLQGSWWYSDPTDLPLDAAARARLASIQETLESSHDALEAVALLELALTPGTDPSTVRGYLMEAQQALEATGEPELATLITDLRSIIIDMRPQGQESTRPSFTPELDGP